MARSRLFRVLPLLLALAAAGCETKEGIFVVEDEGAKPITIEEYVGPALAAEIEGIFDRFDGMVADQSLPELLELGAQRKAEIAAVITKSLSHEEFLDRGLRMPLEVYREPVPKLDEAITAALEGY
jgi:hypothetical protein